MIIEQHKFANYSTKLKQLRTIEEIYDRDTGSVILYDNKEDSETACKNRNEWHPAGWICVPVTLTFEVPDNDC